MELTKVTEILKIVKEYSDYEKKQEEKLEKLAELEEKISDNIERTHKEEKRFIDYLEENKLLDIKLGDLKNELCALHNIDPKEVNVTATFGFRAYVFDDDSFNNYIKEVNKFNIELENSTGDFYYTFFKHIDLDTRLDDGSKLFEHLDITDEGHGFYNVNIHADKVDEIILNLKVKEDLFDYELISKAIYNYYEKKESNKSNTNVRK